MNIYETMLVFFVGHVWQPSVTFCHDQLQEKPLFHINNISSFPSHFQSVYQSNIKFCLRTWLILEGEQWMHNSVSQKSVLEGFQHMIDKLSSMSPICSDGPQLLRTVKGQMKFLAAQALPKKKLENSKGMVRLGRKNRRVLLFSSLCEV